MALASIPIRLVLRSSIDSHVHNVTDLKDLPHLLQEYSHLQIEQPILANLLMDDYSVHHTSANSDLVHSKQTMFVFLAAYSHNMNTLRSIIAPKKAWLTDYPEIFHCFLHWVMLLTIHILEKLHIDVSSSVHSV